jgi:hypothetical protein
VLVSIFSVFLAFWLKAFHIFRMVIWATCNVYSSSANFAATKRGAAQLAKNQETKLLLS